MASLSEWYREIKATYDIGFEGWKQLATKPASEKEQLLMQTGLSRAEAIYFLKQAPLTGTEEWLIAKGTSAKDARELAKTPFSDFEVKLILKGVPPVDARREANAPATDYDVRAAVVAIVEKTSMEHPSLNTPIRTMEDIIMSIRRNPMTKAQLFDATFTLSDDHTIQLSEGMVLQAYERLAKAAAPAGPVVVARKEPATVPEGDPAIVLPTHKDGAVIAQLPQRDGAVEREKTSAKAHLNANILKLLSGEKLDRQTIVDIQEQLNTLGFDCGKADARAGSQTWRGVAAYAKAGHLADANITKEQLRMMEQALKSVGYVHIKADGIIDAETRRATEKFFRLRKESLGDFKPANVDEPDFAALAAIQSGYNKQRGLAPAGK